MCVCVWGGGGRGVSVFRRVRGGEGKGNDGRVCGVLGWGRVVVEESVCWVPRRVKR